MSILIELPEELESALRNRLAASEQQLSEFVSEAIEQKLARDESAAAVDAYDLGKSVFGRYGSGETTRSTSCEVTFREKIRAKHSY